jgi:hypothetical protein
VCLPIIPFLRYYPDGHSSAAPAAIMEDCICVICARAGARYAARHCASIILARIRTIITNAKLYNYENAQECMSVSLALEDVRRLADFRITVSLQVLKTTT